MKRHEPQRVILETSLKPFAKTGLTDVPALCEAIYRCWEPLIRDAQRVSILLWVGDGTEILQWDGRGETSIPWARSIGFCNLGYGAYYDNTHYKGNPAVDFMKDPPRITYAALQRIIGGLRDAFRILGGRTITVGATFDPGPEFVHDPFRFERHPELLTAGPAGDPVLPIQFLYSDARFHADPAPLAGYPHGIPEGTTIGEFLGRQTACFAAAMGIDYLWMSNGFGFSHYGWSHRGELFDGKEFRPGKAAAMRERLLSFWRDFRRACPSLPVEARGSNFSVGMDVAKDGVPFAEICAAASLPFPPPNPPWGSNNLGLEMVSFLSRMAGAEGGRILFRFYLNDPWFVSDPWRAYYGREPYDIQCPMSASRISRAGAVETPTDVAFLSIDDEKGDVDPEEAAEVIPHVRRAFRCAPDAPGILTWVYPYAAYNAMSADGPQRPGLPFFHDWFVSRAVSAGLPLNTVVSDEAFLATAGTAAYRDTVLLAPVPVRGSALAPVLLAHVRSGGKAILYGPAEDADAATLTALGLRLEAPLSGDFELEVAGAASTGADVFLAEQPPRRLRHDAATSGGGLREAPEDPRTRLLATARSEEGTRAYALARTDPAWNGGSIAWVRGSSPLVPSPTIEPVFQDPGTFADPSALPRILLGAMGYGIAQEREGPHARPICTFISRHRGGFHFSGYSPDLTVAVSYRFPSGAPVFEGTDTVVSAQGARYMPGRSFHRECRVFVRQEETSLVTYREGGPRVGKERQFLVTGLRKADVTIFPYPEALREGGVSVREAEVDGQQDPGSPSSPRNRKIDRDHLGREIPVRVDGARGCVVVAGVTGAISVLW